MTYSKYIDDIGYGLFSLTKLADQPIRDIIGVLDSSTGEVIFKLRAVVLDDYTRIMVGGEHDLPYLEGAIPNGPDLEILRQELRAMQASYVAKNRIT